MRDRGLAVVALLLAAGCVQEDAAKEPQGVTWYNAIQPLMVSRCGSCHTPGGLAPFTLDKYETASVYADSALWAVENGTMPPWGAQDTEECTPPKPWKDDMRLSEAEKQLLRDWVAAGAPLGEESSAVPVPTPPDLGLANASVTMQFQQPFTVQGTSDIFECFVLDPGNTSDGWITGVQVNGGNNKVDHHALVFVDLTGESEALATDGHFPCFSNPDIDGMLVGAWAPGARPFEIPETGGMRLPVGSRIVVQMHFHPTPNTETDQSSVSLRYTTETPTYEAVLALLGNFDDYDEAEKTGLLPGPEDAPGAEPQFVIPAGVANHVETMVYRNDLPLSAPIFQVGAHMHYVGVDMKIDRRREGSTTDECLLQTPKWDFNWQRGYTYDAPIDELPTIRPGDEVRMRCTYNNSTSNSAVVAALAEQGLPAPVDVTLGEETLDEMCLGVFGVLVPPGLF